MAEEKILENHNVNTTEHEMSSLAWTSLPKEMCIEIWSNLDFDTLKICTRVSKKWLDDIRGSTRLSSEIYLNMNSNRYPIVFSLSVEDINAVLSRWPRLKTLHVSNLDSISRLGINFGELPIFGTAKFVEKIAGLIENDDSHNLAFHYNDAAFVVDGNSSGVLENIGAKFTPSLEKIIISQPEGISISRSKRYLNENQLKELIVHRKLEVEKIWLDPKNIMSPIKIENVLGIHFEPSGNDELDAYLKKIRPMTIETLSINPLGLIKPWKFDWILSFKNLKKLTIKGVILDVDLSYMFDVVKKIDGMKTIQLADCWLKKDFFYQFLKQFPPGHSLIIHPNCMIHFHITSLLEILNSLGEMKAQKNLKIYDKIVVRLDNDLDKEKTKEILKKAQEIIDEKFDELEYANLREEKYGFSLSKEKGKLWNTMIIRK